MNASAKKPLTGKRIRIRGLVQGVGFRPTVWRLAQQHQLVGHIFNDGEGVLIEAHGNSSQLADFIRNISLQCPPLARIDSIEQQTLSANSFSSFTIIESKKNSSHTSIIADAATCPACIEDTFQQKNRRYHYPFNNCTHCGPRFSIIKAIPYDRADTSMADFKPCPDCQADYETPSDRRFHAQTNACPVCGPSTWLEPASQNSDISPIDTARSLIQEGYIVAIKGIGGFHLVCDATNRKAVSCLRKRKNRPHKPFALMAAQLNIIKQYCSVSTAESHLMLASSAPIVLLEKKASGKLLTDIAPTQKSLGFMLPHTPLQHLLLQNMTHPIVMTSGNISHNPPITDNTEALNKLEGIADYFLLNNRAIINRVDDSVLQIVNDKPQVLRRARGYAPTPISLPAGFEKTPDLLAFGSELKNTFCLIKDNQAILSQYIGDLKNAPSFADFEKNLSLYQHLYQHQPTAFAVDAHPDYLSTKLAQHRAKENNLPVIQVQHHHAHIASCLADNAWPLNKGKVLGIALDGLGYGDDKSLWGGDFLLCDYQQSKRLAHFKPFALLGATQAMLQPWRNTYAQLMDTVGWQKLNSNYAALELVSFLKEKPCKTLDTMLKKGINSPLSSSCGRLFDAVAAALGLCREQVSYEGQAALELENLVDKQFLNSEQHHAYPFTIKKNTQQELLQIETESLWIALLNDLLKKTPIQLIATRFHIGLAGVIVDMTKKLIATTSSPHIDTIVLSGGVFQNKILSQLVNQSLQKAGFRVLTHSSIPSNDAGLALGQALIALAQLKKQQDLCA